MQVRVNARFLTKRRNLARWGGYVGIGSLLVGLLITTSYPESAIGQFLIYPFLLIGLLGATYGSYMTNRYVREPRGEQVLEDVLEKLDERYTLYAYYLPSRLVIASHYGLTVIEPQAQGGEIRYENGRWHHKAGMGRLGQFFGEPSLGRPEQTVEQEVGQVQNWVHKYLPDQDVPVNGVVLFTNPKAVLAVADAPVPALTPDQVMAYMRQGMKGQPMLSTARQKELGRVLDALVDAS